MRPAMVILAAAGLYGQQFEVVSIHPVPANAPTVMREMSFTAILPGGQFIHSRTSLVDMIATAYDVRFPDNQLKGLPGWAKDQSYAVSAKPRDGFPLLPAAENAERVKLMLRAMLADRFQLRLHSENRQERVLNLEVAKGGFRFKEVDAPVPPAKENHVGLAMGNSGGRMVGHQSTVAGIATALTILFGQRVVDQTGLKGYYDFDVKWSGPEGAVASSGLGTEGVGLAISALQEQFGLKATQAMGPVEYWVVDHVERPSGN